MDRTLILVKPDAFARNLTGEIIARFERKGLRLVALKLETIGRELAERHYAEHVERPFFGELVDFITSGPLVAMVLEGHEAVAAARQVIGATNPLEAATGSIRGDYALKVDQKDDKGNVEWSWVVQPIGAEKAAEMIKEDLVKNVPDVTVDCGKGVVTLPPEGIRCKAAGDGEQVTFLFKLEGENLTWTPVE